MDKKKEYSLLKIVLIPLLIYLVLTWFIPAGSFSSGEFVKGDVSSLGLYGLFNAPVYSFAVFAQYIILILCVGGFYGVLNKTGVYQRIVDSMAKKSKTSLLIFTVILFAVLASVFGETMLVFILLPFFVSVLLKAGFDKVSSMAATVGATLIGMVASISGNLAIFKNYFNLEPKVFIIFNIIMLVVLMFLLCMFIHLKNKNNKERKELIKDIPLYESVKDNKKSIVPLVIVLVLSILLITLGSYNWFYSYGVSLFNDLHTKITSIELFNVNIFPRIFGDFSEIGSFSNYDISAILVIASVITSWIYSIKFSEFIDGFKKGVKEMILPGIYVVLASIVFGQVVTASGNISLTISNSILKISDKFNILTGMLTGIVGSFFYNDFLYFMNGLYGVVSTYEAGIMPFVLSVFQSTFGIMMFVLPVSVLVIGGLKYLNISYKEWIKYIWKFLLQVLAISIIGNIILSMII
jgi:uncharacterized ion transporter superfamily protein YfcC